jgi:hypothetical protein
MISSASFHGCVQAMRYRHRSFDVHTVPRVQSTGHAGRNNSRQPVRDSFISVTGIKSDGGSGFSVPLPSSTESEMMYGDLDQ